MLSHRMIVARAGASGLLLAMPAAFANVVLAAQEPAPKAALNATLLGLLAGFVLAGYVTGIEGAADTARTGALAGFVVFVPIELVGILGRLDRGDSVHLFGIVIIGFLAAGAGTVGSQLGARRRARKEAT